MSECPIPTRILILLLLIIAFSGCVTRESVLEYPTTRVEYHIATIEQGGNYTLSEVTFLSMGTQIAGLLRVPNHTTRVPGIVLLPGAGVTKEGEQGLARYLASIGYATITIDQRNLGVVDVNRDLELFQAGEVPEEHKMVHDALAAAAVLREQPGIDRDRIVYMGESNGARFAIIACAIDRMARGVIAISTCGYDVDTAIATGALRDAGTIEFFRSIDPDCYLDRIAPRKFVIIHSVNDPVIQYNMAVRTYAKASVPKSMHKIETHTHGYCDAMNGFIKDELHAMVR